MNRQVSLFLVLTATLLLANQSLADIWYVDGAASPGGSGMTWGSAFQTIQQGVAAAAAADEIWVKKGTYLLTAQILVDVRVSIYGGFAGTETSRTQRNPTTNVTTIDGNNSVRCLYVTANNVVVDGFTITKGLTAGSDRGAGLFNTVSGSGTNTTVANCKFINNRCPGNSGGGIYDEQGHMTISGCTFQGNTSNNRGGAVYVYYTSASSFGTADFTDCSFIQNTSGSGGALFFKGGAGAGPNSITDCSFQQNNAYSDAGSNDGGAIVCDPTTTITRCTFIGNTASRYGTIATYGDAGNTITVTSSLFSGNEVEYGGGICVNGTSGYLGSLIVTNCTFSGNVASGGGGAFYNLKATNASSVFRVTNSILWADTAPEIGGTGGAPTVSYSDVQGGYAGTGNINANPLFVSASNLHLTGTSPCIDAGTNSAPSMPLQDIDGEDRTMDGDENGSSIADMGADEFNPGSTPPGWTATTVPPTGDPGVRIGQSATVNALAMLLLPFGAIVAAAAFRRRR